MRLHPHLGELPSGAFQHCGDKKIKLQGGGGGIVDDFVDTFTDPIKDAGSWIDDKINEEIPGGWITVAALAGGAYYGAEALAAGNAAEAAAIAEGATVAEAAAAGASAATATEAAVAGGTDFLGSQALGGASTGAVGSGATGVGLSAGTTGGAAAGTGISTGSLVGTPLGAGMGTVGTNAASGLGYLGGAEALPSGTAGITGVTAPTSLSLSDAQNALRLGQLLGGQQPVLPTGQQPQQQAKQRGMVDYSPTLSLLDLKRVRTPNIYSLLG
jgi:hypothetical protein